MLESELDTAVVRVVAVRQERPYSEMAKSVYGEILYVEMRKITKKVFFLIKYGIYTCICHFFGVSLHAETIVRALWAR